MSNDNERQAIPPDEEPTVCAICGDTASPFAADGWEEGADGQWYCPNCQDEQVPTEEECPLVVSDVNYDAGIEL